MKKIFALVMTLLMIACMFVVPASAAGGTVPVTKNKITIDGNIDASEWKGALKVSLAGKDMQTALGSADANFHAGSYMYLAYDKDNLYIGAYITDTTYMSGDTPDALMFIFYKPSDTTNAIVGPPNNVLVVTMPGSSSITEASKSAAAISGAKCASKQTAEGYTVEVSLPASFFNSFFKTHNYDPFDLVEGSKFKMQVLVQDFFTDGTSISQTDTAYANPAMTAVYTLGKGVSPITTAPVTSNTPASSDAPATSDETPSTSDETPGSDTSAPDTTGSAADTTKAPDTTKDAGTKTESKSNVGMIVGIVAAVAVVAAIVIVVVVKKKKS